MLDMYDNYGPNGFLNTECDKCYKDTRCKAVGPNGGVLAFCITCNPEYFDGTTPVYSVPAVLPDLTYYHRWAQVMARTLSSHKNRYRVFFDSTARHIVKRAEKELTSLQRAIQAFNGAQSARRRDDALRSVETCYKVADVLLFKLAEYLVLIGATADYSVDYVEPSGPYTDLSQRSIPCECGRTGRWIANEHPQVGEYLQCPSCQETSI